jgi:CubicO group peptidase (beta-lactamase class C family)
LNRGFHKAVIAHAGYTGTFVRMDRLAGVFVVILTNRVFPDDSGNDYRMRREILRIVLESDPVYRDVAVTPRRR